MKLFQTFGITTAVLLVLIGVASAQSWTPLAVQPRVNLGPMLQLRDGRILVHEEQQGDASAWHILTPDPSGSYVNGTWSSGGHLPAGYAPFYFGSQVLLDGKHVVIEGGEYNNGILDWTTLGAYGTLSGGTIAWVNNNPPAGWSTIGDAQSVILADGRYMQANSQTTQNAIFHGPNSWLPTGNIVGRTNDEQAFTLLPSGKVLTVEAWTTSCHGNLGSELFDPATGTWSCAAATPTQLWDNSGHELGPALLMYNSKVLQIGATNNTAIYNPVTNTWVAGPTPANGLTGYDAPASLEANGKVLVMLGPTGFNPGCQFVEYDPRHDSLANTANPTNCPADPSFVGHLMVLPTGQIMFTDFSGLVEVYKPASGVVRGVKPTIVHVSKNLASGSANNRLSGFQLNGLSQNNAYGDDYQGDTNFPLVRLKSVATGNVSYATTHGDSSHSIAHGNTLMHTKFDLPALQPDLYDLVVVANGIASNPIRVSVH